MKKDLLVYILLFISFFDLSCVNKNSEEQRPPNILFIMSDDHSYQTISAYDDTFIQTPNIDRIANEGVLFSNSFVTNSICAPSRAVMLTGKHSHMNGQVDNFTRFDSSQLTFPKLLQQSGYQTAMIGKWHLKSQPTGFDYWDVLIGQGQYYNTDFITNGTKVRSQGYVTDVIADKSLDWLESRDKDKPFLMLTHHKATHRNWMPDTSLLNEFSGVKFDVPDNFFDDYNGRLAAEAHVMGIDRDMDLVYDLKMHDKEESIPSKYRALYKNMYGRMNEEEKETWDAYYNPIIEVLKESGMKDEQLALWKYQRYMQDYLKCVISVDNSVGRILDYLDDNGLAENTIIVYTSDQGFYMGEHGWFDKRFMYEESFRTPLVMRFPKGIKKNSKVEEMVQNIDYAPTFLEYAGVNIPDDMQGLSLKPLLENESSLEREAIYYHYYEFPNEHGTKKHYGIRTDQYKLIHFYEDIDVWELYDLKNDAKEMENLYGRDSYDGLVHELKRKLKDLQIKYQVTT